MARTFRSARLAAELRRIRADLDLNADDVAARADIAQSSLSRIETASVGVRVNTIKVLLDVYGVTGQRRDALLTLAHEAGKKGWWHSYGTALPKWFEYYVDMETEATCITAYDAQFVHGLVQTEDYARAVYLAARPEESRERIDRRVALRMERQRRVMGGQLDLRLVMEEWVLLRPYGGAAVMRDQLRRLIDAASMPNVCLQVLPLNAQPGVVGPFALLEFGETYPTVAYLENEIGAVYPEETAQIEGYARTYDRLRAAALSPEETISRLKEIEESIDEPSVAG